MFIWGFLCSLQRGSASAVMCWLFLASTTYIKGLILRTVPGDKECREWRNRVLGSCCQVRTCVEVWGPAMSQLSWALMFGDCLIISGLHQVQTLTYFAFQKVLCKKFLCNRDWRTAGCRYESRRLIFPSRACGTSRFPVLPLSFLDGLYRSLRWVTWRRMIGRWSNKAYRVQVGKADEFLGNQLRPVVLHKLRKTRHMILKSCSTASLYQ